MAGRRMRLAASFTRGCLEGGERRLQVQIAGDEKFGLFLLVFIDQLVGTIYSPGTTWWLRKDKNINSNRFGDSEENLSHNQILFPNS